MTMLRVEGLACGHTAPVLRDVAFELAAGERLAVMGPNGSGKSTLLHTLAGLLKPAAGRVSIDGADVAAVEATARARKIALLPQAFDADPGLTVYEFAAIGRTPWLGPFGRLSRRDDEAIARALAACKLEEFSARRIGELSGGERQRARIAMLLAQEAPLVLLDEPTAFLDLKHRYELFALLDRLAAEHTLALVAVLHDLNEALKFAKKLLLVGQGTAKLVDAADRDAAAGELAHVLEVPRAWIPLSAG